MIFPCICEWHFYLKEWWLIASGKVKHYTDYYLFMHDGSCIIRYWHAYPGNWMDILDKERKEYYDK